MALSLQDCASVLEGMVAFAAAISMYGEHCVQYIVGGAAYV
jgi:hypothetical protein